MTKERSELLKKEDYWAIWLGAFLLAVGLVLFYFLPYQEISEKADQYRQVLENEEKYGFKTIEWYEAKAGLDNLSSSNTEVGIVIEKLFAHPQKWTSNPLESFTTTEAEAIERSASEKKEVLKMSTKVDDAKESAANVQELTQRAGFSDEELNTKAESAIAEWLSTKKEYESVKKKAAEKSFNLFTTLPVLGILLALMFGVGSHFMGIRFGRFLPGFLGVFLLAVVAHFLGNQAEMKDLGFGYALWAIVIGLLISNTLGTPEWIKPAVKTEFYIKTGLVLLGAEILFGKILSIGLPGIFVSWVVTPIVLVTTFWFGQKILRITSKTLNITISADMSVCGVSAAIATAAACNAKKEELTLAVGLSMTFTAVMMVALPALIKAGGMPEVLGGAWIGGTIDATGAVVAAGAFLGEKALTVAATIKMIQNMLIGLIAFAVAVYWATKVEKKGSSKVGAGEIWKRFPKFILGFVGASLIFSVLFYFSGHDLGNALIDNGVIGSFAKDLRGWFFSLAFVCIGLSVNFRELKHHFKGGKPLILYVSGQLFNLLLTLLMAYLMFYVVFPEITEAI